MAVLIHTIHRRIILAVVTVVALAWATVASGAVKNALSFVDLGLSVRWADGNLQTVSSPTDTFMPLGADLCAAWQIPSILQWEELQNECDWMWTTDAEGRTGYLVTGKKAGYTDCHIFLPAEGIRADDTVDRKGVAGRYASSTDVKSFPGLWNIYSIEKEKHLASGAREGAYVSVRTVQALEPSQLTDITMKPAQLDMCVSGKYALKVATGDRGALLPEVMSWNSSDPECAVVSEGGVVTALTPGDVVITASHQGRQVACHLSVHAENVKYVDLGTGILWADRNQGAYSPEQYGGEYHHEITGKMPGKNDWERLMSECIWVPAEENGVTGFRIYGKTESTRQNSIFLPYDDADPGFGYWTKDETVDAVQIVLFRLQQPYFNAWRIDGGYLKHMRYVLR